MTRLLANMAVLSAALLVSGAAWAQTAAPGQMTGLKLSGDKPIQIESDKLEVDQNKSVAVFTGDVSVVQGATLLKAGRLTVYYTKDEKNGDKNKSPSQEATSSSAASTSAAPPNGASNIERLEADGKVYVKSDDQVATGDHGSFDMKSQVLVLSGDQVVLTQGDNVIVGCQLTVHTQSGQAQLDGCDKGASGGRVKMLLKPDSKNKK